MDLAPRLGYKLTAAGQSGFCQTELMDDDSSKGTIRMKKLLALAFLTLAASFASAGQIYATYTGDANGVTIRDAETLEQTFFFDPGFAVDHIAAGNNNSLYLTSGNSIYNYSTTGNLINSFAFNGGITYGDIAHSGTDIYAGYSGSADGVTVRDANTFAQSNFIDTGFVVDGLAAGRSGELYLTSGNRIFNFSATGDLLNSFAFDGSINYGGITYAGNDIYAAYSGSATGVTVRDSTTLEQSHFIDLDFAVNDLVAGVSSDLFLTSGNAIYHYADDGTQLNSFAFPSQGITYGGIAFAPSITAKVPEPSTLALLSLGLMGAAIRRKKTA